MRKFILLLSFSQSTPLHLSARSGHVEVCRLLVESKADVAARERCFSPPPSHHLSLTICLAAGATLHSKMPSRTTKPTLLHTCAASALLNEAPTSVTCPQNGSSKRLQSKSSRWQPARAPASRSRSIPTLLQRASRRLLQYGARKSGLTDTAPCAPPPPSNPLPLHPDAVRCSRQFVSPLFRFALTLCLVSLTGGTKAP